MTSITAAESDMLSKVVRGESPLEALEAIGMKCHLEGNRCWVDNPRQITASADTRDLACGLLAYRADPILLRRWAMFIEAADIEISAEEHPFGDVVLNALWDAAFSKVLDADTIKTLQSIVRDEVAR